MSRRPSLVRRAGPLGAPVAAALLLACSGGSAQAPAGGEAACGPARVLGELPAELEEASGLAADPRRADLLWLHNDSDNDPVLHAVDTAGRLLASYDILGATDVDPEDLALGPCGDRLCLYLGDIGDNFSLRPEVLVHRLPLPPLPSARSGGKGTPKRGGSVTAEATLRLRYPGGPRDAEGLAIDARRGELLLISKGRDGIAALYAAPLEAGGDAPVLLRRVGSLRVPLGLNTGQLITAADLSGDGRRLAVRSYTTLFLFPWPGTAAFDTTVAPASASLAAAAEPQGEGLAFGVEPGAIYLASESRGGRPQQLGVLSCPEP